MYALIDATGASTVSGSLAQASRSSGPIHAETLRS